MQSMSDIQKKRLKKTLKEVAVVILAGFLYYLFVRIRGKGFPCIFNELTGWLCPGCGASRMCMSLIRFDFASAFHYNPALLFILPILFTVLAVQKIRYIRTGDYRARLWENIVFAILGVLLVAFSVYRNIYLPPI